MTDAKPKWLRVHELQESGDYKRGMEQVCEALGLPPQDWGQAPFVVERWAAELAYQHQRGQDTAEALRIIKRALESSCDDLQEVLEPHLLLDPRWKRERRQP